MLEFYEYSADAYYNDKFICEVGWGQLLTDKKPQDKEYNATWDNIVDILESIPIRGDYDIRQRKKGMKISFYNWNGFWYEIKQWKSPELNVKIKVSYKKINKSISKVLEWPDSEKALKYLVERGLTVIQKYDTIEKR